MSQYCDDYPDSDVQDEIKPKPKLESYTIMSTQTYAKPKFYISSEDEMTQLKEEKAKLTKAVNLLHAERQELYQSIQRQAHEIDVLEARIKELEEKPVQEESTQQILGRRLEI